MTDDSKKQFNTVEIAGMRQADAAVGGLRIAVATGVPQEPAVKAAGSSAIGQGLMHCSNSVLFDDLVGADEQCW